MEHLVVSFAMKSQALIKTEGEASTESPTSLFALGEGGRDVFLGTQTKKIASLVRPTSQEQNWGSAVVVLTGWEHIDSSHPMNLG